MTAVTRLEPCFVDDIPASLAPGVLYISIDFGTAQHLCACGCGHEVVTPLHPAQWGLFYDGETVSLWPSVGNHGLPCRSHYVIRDNEVLWSRPWSADEIAAGRRRDRLAIETHILRGEDRAEPRPGPEEPSRPGLARRVIDRLCRW